MMKRQLQVNTFDTSAELHNASWEVFEAIPVPAAIVGDEGKIEKVNCKWQNFVAQNDLCKLADCESTNCGEFCFGVTRERNDLALQAFNGVNSVLKHEVEHFSLEYPYRSSDTNGWFLLAASPLAVNSALLLNIDITKYKLAEEDLAELKLAEDELRKCKDQLGLQVIERTTALEDANAALRVILKQYAEDKEKLREMVLTNVRHSIRPHIKELRKCNLPADAVAHLDALELKITEITAPFVRNLLDNSVGLTPMEIRVGELIRDGISTKEIARRMHIAPGTVRYHRENLRQKLGIKGKSVNLKSFLKALQ